MVSIEKCAVDKQNTQPPQRHTPEPNLLSAFTRRSSWIYHQYDRSKQSGGLTADSSQIKADLEPGWEKKRAVVIDLTSPPSQPWACA